MKKIINIYISLFYVGYIKFASGTLGSLISIIILYPFIKNEFFSLNILIIFFFFIIIISLLFIEIYSKQTQTYDSTTIVIDEFIGIFFIFIFYEFIFFKNDFITLVLIFFLFRFFDILKIFPANLIDRNLKNSFGVIFDDIIAAIYTILTMIIINVI